jgi:hypothetical protein
MTTHLLLLPAQAARNSCVNCLSKNNGVAYHTQNTIIFVAYTVTLFLL